MTVKELIRRLVEIPVLIEEAEVKFENQQLLVVVNKEADCSVFIISE